MSNLPQPNEPGDKNGSPRYDVERSARLVVKFFDELFGEPSRYMDSQNAYTDRVAVQRAAIEWRNSILTRLLGLTEEEVASLVRSSFEKR